MRKIIVEAEVSIDGAMGGENADFWKQVFPYHSPDVAAYLSDLLFTPDALLMGKKTYESFAMVWPTRQGKDADRINTMPKYVVSRTLNEPLAWNATLIQGDVVEAIKKLKQEPGKGLAGERCACATTLSRSASAASLSVSSNSIGARRWRMCHSR